MLARKIGLSMFSTLSLPKISFKPQPFSGNYSHLTSLRKKYYSPIYRQFYDEPLLIVEGHMQYLFDHEGNRYIDLEGNDGQVTIGHSHPEITKIVQDQSATLIHTSTIYMHQKHGEISEKLHKQLGKGFENVYVCNTAGEANDFALFITRQFCQDRDPTAFRNAYHGTVGLARSATNIGSWDSQYLQKNEFERLSWPETSKTSSEIKKVRSIFQSSSSGKAGPVIYECIQSKVGGKFPAAKYFSELNKLVHEKGGVTICDQTNTGLGRIGKSYWAHRLLKHRPDVVTVGKGLGNGLPFAAVATRNEISSAMKFIFFNTFSAGPLQSRVGIAVLDIIKKEKLAENAEVVGKDLLGKLESLAANHKEKIGAVCGKGLMLSIEIVDPQNPEVKTKKLMELARKRNLLFGRSGVNGNVLTIRPPLCFNSNDAAFVASALDDALHAL